MIFGITGDLARKMTFQALYRLERRGDLDCRRSSASRATSGDEEELDGHAREAIEATVPEPDEEAIKRLDERLDYVHGEFDDDETYQRLAEEMGDVRAGRLLPRDPAVAVRATVVQQPARGRADRRARGW